MNLIIRQEEIKDFQETKNVVKEAFLSAEMSDGNEHNLIEKLRKSESYIPELSLVAQIDHQIVGHVMLTKNQIIGKESQFESLTLAPLSVLPTFEGKGIGTQLMKAVLKQARFLGFKSVIVLGHPDYYPRFGFKPAATWNIKAPFEVPSEAFMALELVSDGLKEVNGTVQYPREFL